MKCVRNGTIRFIHVLYPERGSLYFYEPLGLEWQNLKQLSGLSGNLGQYESRAVALTAQVTPFDPIRLMFAWTRAENIPLILGQVNFFLEYDVCFFRARAIFEVSPKV